MDISDKQQQSRHWFEGLPDRILDDIISYVVSSSPPSRIMLLSELGSTIFRASCRSLFGILIVEDDMRRFTEHLQSQIGHNPLSSILLNPGRYGKYVRQLLIVDPSNLKSWEPRPSYIGFESPSMREKRSEGVESNPITAQNLLDLLRYLSNLETFSWKATVTPPDGVCEMLSTHNRRLTSFYYMPAERLLPVSRAILASLPRWNGLSLPLLSSLNLKSIRVSRLSQSGVHSFVRLLSMLETDSQLEEVCIDTNWLDESLCQQIGSACSKLRRIEIGSDGSRFSDKSLVTLLPLCEHLEAFTLREVQGRLSKTLWEKILDYPSRLRHFQVNINENSIQHAWNIDHLSSLSNLPVISLTHLIIRRTSSPFQDQVHDVAILKPVPSAFVRSLENARDLQHLECDWWSWSCDNLRTPLESCPDLRVLRIAFEEPFQKLLSMVLPFSNANRLGSVAVTLSPRHFTILPPSPTLSNRRSVSRSPSVSPVQFTRSLPSSADIPSSLDDQSNSPLHSSNPGSSSNIPLRDIRKFAKRCHALYEIIIYGKYGERVHWAILRHPSNSNPEVSLLPPLGLSEDMWDAVRREEAGLEANWSPLHTQREGSEWAGPIADEFAELYTNMRREEAPTKLVLESNNPLKSSPVSPSKAIDEGTVESIQRDASRPLIQIPSPVSPEDMKEASVLIHPSSALDRRRRVSDLTTHVEEPRPIVPVHVRRRAQSYNGNKRALINNASSVMRNSGRDRSRDKGADSAMQHEDSSASHIRRPSTRPSETSTTIRSKERSQRAVS
ncbi:peroxin [Serendipita sp. 407]|nr:peroxin [Serendipita sp. 407]